MNIIVCIDEKNGIGKNNNLLYSIPDDMKYFREKTKDSIVIMGRKTLYSFKDKAPLKNRINIVFTKDKDKLNDEYKSKGYDNIFFVDNIDSIKDLVEKYKYDENNIERKSFVIGGASIYSMMLDMCDTLYITKMYKTFDADTFFPDFESRGYEVIEKSDISEYNDIRYQFIVYKK